MQHIILLSLLIIVTATVSVPQFDSPPDDCCALTWEPIIDRDGRRFFPSSAIPFTQGDDGSTVYFAQKPDLGVRHVGAITDGLKSPLYIYVWDSGTVTQPGWVDAFVLSNPHNCVLEWRSQKTMNFNSTFSHEFPSLDTVFFCASSDGFIGSRPPDSTTSGNSKGMIMQNMSPRFHDTSDYNILSIDCAASLRKTLGAELFDIEYEVKPLVSEGSESGLKVLSLTEVTNDSDFDQEATVNLESQVIYSLQMSHDTQLYTMMDTKWGVHASIKASFIGELFGIGGSVDSGYDSHSLKQNFTRTGQVSFESARKQFKYEQKILVKARSKTKVSMNTQPITSSPTFKAHYKIQPTKAGANVTLSQVSHSLLRQGFTGYDNLKQDENGTVFLTVEGKMSVDAGVDTHILIESVGIGNNSETFRSTRLVGLDQLSSRSLLMN